MPGYPKENWTITKSVVTGDGGIVVSQHHEASHVGASVLAQGGNAIDAAIATSAALGVVEPWMSGIGGCGNLLVYLAEEQKTQPVLHRRRQAGLRECRDGRKRTRWTDSASCHRLWHGE